MPNFWKLNNPSYHNVLFCSVLKMAIGQNKEATEISHKTKTKSVICVIAKVIYQKY